MRTYVVCEFFLDNVSFKECYNLAGRIFIRLDFVWEHFVDYNSFDVFDPPAHGSR